MSKGTLRGEGTVDMYRALQNITGGRAPGTLERTAENAPVRFMMSAMNINSMGKEAAAGRIKRHLCFAGEHPKFTWETLSNLYGSLTGQVDALSRIELLKKRNENERLSVFSRRRHTEQDEHVGVAVNGGPSSAYSMFTYGESMRGNFSKVRGFAQRLKHIKEAVTAVREHYLRSNALSMNADYLKRTQERIEYLTANEEAMREEEHVLLEWLGNRPESVSTNRLLGRGNHRTDEPTVEALLYHFLRRQSFAYQMSQQQRSVRSSESQIAQAEGASGVLLVDPAAVQKAFEEWVDDVMEWLYTPTTTDGGEEE